MFLKLKLFIKKFRYLLLFFVIALFVLVYFLISPGKPKQLSVVDTGIISGSFFQKSGDSFYFYNGLGFYKIDQKTNQPNLLVASNNLPQVNKIHWGESGAIIGFSNSQSNFSALYTSKDGIKKTTTLSDISNQEGFFNTDINRASWYIDYKSGRVSFIRSFVTDDWAVIGYNDRSDEYLISSDGLPTKQPAVSFKPKTGVAPSLIDLNKDLSVITDSFNCSDNTICLIGQSKYSEYQLASYPKKINAKTEQGMSSITPTTNPDYVLLGFPGEPIQNESDKPPSQANTEEDHSDEIETKKVYKLYQISANKLQEIVLPDSANTTRLVAVNNSVLVMVGVANDGTSTIYFGNIGDKSVKMKIYNNNKFISIKNIIDFKNGNLLVSTTDNSIVALVSDDETNQFPSVSYTLNKDKLTPCITRNDASVVDRGKLVLTLEDTETIRTKEVRDCLLSKPIPPLGMVFNFDIIATKQGPVLY